MTTTLQVPLQEWLAAMKPFLKVKAPKRGESGEVMLTYEKGRMVFCYGGIETQAETDGDWPGAAYMDWSYLQRSAKIPPLKNPVIVEVSGNRLKIEVSVCLCRWTPTAAGKTPAFVNEPLTPNVGKDTSFLKLISMGIDYSDEKVASFGLTSQVEQAREK
jgi:hypothetical protein